MLAYMIDEIEKVLLPKSGRDYSVKKLPEHQGSSGLPFDLG
jgi:hypothetical protein